MKQRAYFDPLIRQRSSSTPFFVLCSAANLGNVLLRTDADDIQEHCSDREAIGSDHFRLATLHERWAILEMHQVEQRENASIIHVGGELDMASSTALTSIIKLVEGRQAQRIVVSLEGCSYCYAAGLSVLVAAQDRIGRSLFVVVPVDASFRRIFEITGLSKVLQIVPNVRSALDGMQDADPETRVASAAPSKRSGVRLAPLPRSA